MKKLIIIGICILIMSSFVTGIDLSNNVVACFNLTDKNDYLGNLNSTTLDNPTQFSGSNCYLGGCLEFDGNNDAILSKNYIVNATEGSFSWGIHFYDAGVSTTDQNDWILGQIENPKTQAISVTGVAGGIYQLRFSDGNDGNLDLNQALDSNWHYLVATYNASTDETTWFVDNVYVNQHSGMLSINPYENIGIGCAWDQDSQVCSRYAHARLDEFIFYNKTLNLSELTYAQNLSCYNVTHYTNPSLEITTDLVNNTINFNDNPFLINYSYTTIDLSNTQTNCTLYVNNVSNITQLNRNESTDYQYNFSSVNIEDFTTFEIVCNNSEIQSSTGVYLYNIDTIQPTLNLCNPVFINNTVYNQSQVLYFCYNQTDSNNFATNFTEFNLSNNGILRLYYAENLTMGTYTNSTSKTLNSPGNFSILIQGWDSHTNNKVKLYKIDYLENGVEFNDNIRITGEIKDFDTHKKSDRYDFEIEFNKKGWNNITLESIYPIKYLPDSQYPLHFVSISTGQWIDFNPDNKTEVISYSVNKITNNKYEILLNTDKKKVYFHSIGDLNYNSQQYYYEVLPVIDQSGNLTAIVEQLEDLNSTFTLTYGVIKMIPLVALYIFFVWFAYTLLKKRDTIVGMGLMFTTLGIDSYLIYWVYTTYIQGVVSSPNDFATPFIIPFILSLIMWIIVKFVMVFYIKVYEDKRLS